MIVSEPILAKISRQIGVGKFLMLSRGEVMSGGRNRRSILGDAFEALIGAIFKDSDYYTAKNVALKFLLGKINKLEEIEGTGDYKTILQEFVQGKYKKMPEYKLLRTKGPDHNKVFEICVRWNDKIYGIGTGKSKKEAEKHAAKEALEKLKK